MEVEVYMLRMRTECLTGKKAIGCRAWTTVNVSIRTRKGKVWTDVPAKDDELQKKNALQSRLDS